MTFLSLFSFFFFHVHVPVSCTLHATYDYDSPFWLTPLAFIAR